MIVNLNDNAKLEVPLGAMNLFEHMRGKRFSTTFITSLVTQMNTYLHRETFLNVKGGRASRIHLFPYVITTIPKKGETISFGATPPYAFREVGKKCPAEMQIPPFNQGELEFKVRGIQCEVTLLADAILESAVGQFRTEHGRHLEDYASHADNGELELLRTFFGYNL